MVVSVMQQRLCGGKQRPRCNDYLDFMRGLYGVLRWRTRQGVLRPPGHIAAARVLGLGSIDEEAGTVTVGDLSRDLWRQLC